MQRSPFELLCSQCQDVAERILQQLPLTSLAALSPTCRSLNNAVPESFWLRAAQHQYSNAAAVPAYLRKLREPWREHHRTEGPVEELVSYIGFNTLEQLAPFFNERVDVLEARLSLRSLLLHASGWLAGALRSKRCFLASLGPGSVDLLALAMWQADRLSQIYCRHA